MSFVRQALDYLRFGGDTDSDPDEGPVDDYDDVDFAPRSEPRREAPVHRVRGTQAEPTNLTIVRADPKNMDQATAVANEIKRRKPVILNLQGAPEAEATRIRDFIGGVTFGLDGQMRRVADWVFICSPYDMPVERMVLDGMSTGSPRYEADDRNSLHVM